MSEIQLSSFSLTAMEDIFHTYDYESIVHEWVDIGTAMLIVTLLKRTTDTAENFPYGKWASIQFIESQIDDFINAIAGESEE